MFSRCLLLSLTLINGTASNQNIDQPSHEYEQINGVQEYIRSLFRRHLMQMIKQHVKSKDMRLRHDDNIQFQIQHFC